MRPKNGLNAKNNGAVKNFESVGKIMSSPWPGGRPTSATSAASEKQPQTKTQTRPHSAVPKIQSQHTIDVSGLNLQEGDTTTTVAIGKDTYTIGKDSKNSGFRNNLIGPP